MELTTQEGAGVTFPGSAQETPGCGTLCYGLVDKVVIVPRLDSMILDIYSNLNYSMILYIISFTQWMIILPVIAENGFVWLDCKLQGICVMFAVVSVKLTISCLKNKY